MNKLVIRPANLGDLETLLDFEQAIIEYERPMVADMMTEKFTYYDLKELLLSENAQVIVAEQGTQLVGSGHARIKKSRRYLSNEYHAFLGFMYVDPQFRGKGVNRMIVDSLVDWSKKKGLKVVRLTVYDGNQAAIKAYLKTGFKRDIIEMRLAIGD